MVKRSEEFFLSFFVSFSIEFILAHWCIFIAINTSYIIIA